MLFHSLLLPLLAASASAQVITNPSAFPSNAQNNLLTQQLTCSAQRGRFFTAWNHQFNISVSTTTPVSTTAGSTFYLTNTVVGITIPSQHVVCAIAANASQAFVSASVSLTTSNASPSNLTVFSGNITNVPLLFTGDVLLRIPSNVSATLDPLGPITAGSTGASSGVSLGNVNLAVQPQDSAGNDVGGPVWIACGQQSMNVTVATVGIGGTAALSAVSSLTSSVYSSAATSSAVANDTASVAVSSVLPAATSVASSATSLATSPAKRGMDFSNVFEFGGLSF